MKNRGEHNLYSTISSLVVLGAFVVVVMVSLLSEFGIHPDEFDVRACIDWCMSRWIWPDMRLQGYGLGDTYSWYGYTKVCNYTVYFLVMSKIAYFFKLFMGEWPYYRMPNLLLAVLMCITMIKGLRSRDKRYLMIGFGIVVQAWYIYSYVTADALDFTLAFLAVYMLADEKSFLWKVTRGAKDGAGVSDGASRARIICSCILLGIMYGLMLLGKPYYYSILVLTFVVLLLDIIENFKETYVKQMLTRCILILVVACMIFAARAGLDFHYYGFDKATVSQEMMEEYANYDKKPSTPIEEQVQTYHAYEKGYPISFIFEDDPWFRHTYRSFASSRLTLEGQEVYFILMGILYAAILGWMAVSMWTSSEKNTRILLIIGMLLMIGGVLASIVNSYIIDVQPQGRYLLPLPLIACYMGSKVKPLWEKKIFSGLVLVAGVLSLLYFGLVDSRALIDLGYVRSMLG